jgi:hypothetical protein
MKQSNELYVLVNRECPECRAEGRLDVEPFWKVEICPHCDGDRFSWEPVKCPFCGDDILKSELGDDEGSACHASCLEEERRPTRQMWCIVCRKFVRPLVQCASIEHGGWYCGHHTAQELKAAEHRVQRMGLWPRLKKWFGAIAHR